MNSILIIDDDLEILKSLKIFLKRHFDLVEIIQKPEFIPSQLERHDFNAILLDMNFIKGRNDCEEGLSWLSKILKIDPEAVVLMMTAYGDINMAVKAIKEGATDFITKPWENQKLLATLKAATKLDKTKKENIKLLSTQKQFAKDQDQEYGEIMGESEPIKSMLSVLKKVAKTNANVLILGENGTGKELVSRNLHNNSERFNSVLIRVDLGSLTDSLFESELFGYEKGAFTDAKESKPGRIELANDGTLFLDEISNINIANQAKLLSVLQNKKLTRLGSVKEIPVDFRLICASNKSLTELVNQGSFREDLLYRINTVEIHVPPLRERLEDIPLLFDFYFNQFKNRYNKENLNYSKTLTESLKKYNWPGNIRELKHSIERAVILSETNLIGINDFVIKSSNTIQKSNLTLDELEKQYILNTLDKNNGNITNTSEILGISRYTLHRKIKKYEI
ncbi:MAG: sigma-54-dependent Fis family transcriptional regulator [Bacteroidales bacterium]|nr:sigma-54-dependent Fis family transcriptional regulator [Bacteroidales bacterium]